MSNLEIEKTYSPENVEAKWYEAWEKGGHFKPNPEAKKDGYCIIMPPPNVTGQLHMEPCARRDDTRCAYSMEKNAWTQNTLPSRNGSRRDCHPSSC